MPVRSSGRPRLPSQNQLAEQHRAAQARLAAQATREVLRLWLDAYQPREPSVWRALIAALVALISSLRRESSRLATGYYIESRAEARVPGFFVPSPAPEAPREWIEETARIAGARTYGRALSADVPERQARQNAGVAVAGSMERIVLDAGRRTILDAVEEDREAIGWARITDANPCAFCAMLASRGPVYSEATARFEAHPHCACVAAPVWSRDEAWLGHSRDLYEQWRRVTAGYSGAEARRVWRRYWEGRDKSEE
mgnify:CR=1 FL=1